MNSAITRRINSISFYHLFITSACALLIFAMGAMFVNADTGSKKIDKNSISAKRMQDSMKMSVVNVKQDLAIGKIEDVQAEVEEERLNGNKRQAIVSEARKYIGNPYVLGGRSLTGGADCASFVKLIYQQFGYNFSFGNVHTLYDTCGGRLVSVDDMKPGDIIFFGSGGEDFHHVAIYAGEGKIVHAMSEGYGICEINLYRAGTDATYSGKYISHVKRIIG